jgi:hypothetical protein
MFGSCVRGEARMHEQAAYLFVLLSLIALLYVLRD